MNIIVFTGPSLPPLEASDELDATYLPPVSEGDVYQVALEEPEAIGIIDGYFETVPSVWHKEILYAMSRGIHVFGAASMGALRAAELQPFGMEGVGAVFEAYRDGILEDDDEVAMVHGPEEIGYPLLSEAMVNIRRTLSDALAAHVICPTTREVLEAVAKALPYWKRTYSGILKGGQSEGLLESELSKLKNWLPMGRVDQKREDAVAMLRVMKDRFRRGAEPKEILYHFEHTTMWEQATRRSLARAAAA